VEFKQIHEPVKEFQHHLSDLAKEFLRKYLPLLTNYPYPNPCYWELIRGKSEAEMNFSCEPPSKLGFYVKNTVHEQGLSGAPHVPPPAPFKLPQFGL